MPRPILPRTAKSYQAEIERLGRLRTALRLDTALSKAEYQETVGRVDALMDSLTRVLSKSSTVSP